MLDVPKTQTTVPVTNARKTITPFRENATKSINRPIETDWNKESVYDFAYPIYFNKSVKVCTLIFFIFKIGFTLIVLLKLINLEINKIQLVIKFQRSDNSNIIINQAPYEINLAQKIPTQDVEIGLREPRSTVHPQVLCISRLHSYMVLSGTPGVAKTSSILYIVR